jgi:hypothetical protein
VKPLTRNDGLQLFHGMVQHIVDENIAIFVVVLNLHPGLFQAALDDLLRDASLGPAAAAETLGQDLRRGRHHEDVDRFRHLLPHLRGALYVDVKQQVVAMLDGVGERVARRPVEVAEDIRRFQKLIRLLHALEGIAIDVVVFAALLLGAARRARGVADGEVQTADVRAQLADEGGFS